MSSKATQFLKGFDALFERDPSIFGNFYPADRMLLSNNDVSAVLESLSKERVPGSMEFYLRSNGPSVQDMATYINAKIHALSVSYEEVEIEVGEAASVIMLAINLSHPLQDGNKRFALVLANQYICNAGYRVTEPLAMAMLSIYQAEHSSSMSVSVLQKISSNVLGRILEPT